MYIPASANTQHSDAEMVEKFSFLFFLLPVVVAVGFIVRSLHIQCLLNKYLIYMSFKGW